MVVPAPKHVRNLQRSTTPVKQRPPRAEPIHLHAGNPRASGGGWKRFLVGGEKQADFHVAREVIVSFAMIRLMLARLASS